MSKAITFFRNRQQGSGQTYELEIQDPVRPYQIFVFSRKPLDEALVRSRPGSATDEVNNKITQALLRAEGGVVALTYEENRERMLGIIPVAPGDEAAFGSFGFLLPGHPSMRLEPVNKRGIRFPSGSHALIPVDKDAEESLRGLHSYVGYLPPDLESLVFHAIRDPSLDLRVGRLEAAMFKSTTAPGAVPRKGAGVAEPWYKSWLKKPVPAWLVVAGFLGLMLAVASALLYLNPWSGDDSTEVSTGGGADSKSPKGPEDQSRDDDDEQAATPEQKIFAVVEAARGKSADSKFDNLAEKHFSVVRSATDIADKLAPGADGELLVRGLMKLEAFRLDASKKDLFDISDNPSAVYTFYEGLNLDQSSKDMLAAFTCRASGAPSLKKRNSNESIQFAGSCEPDGSLGKATAGLDRLLKHLQGS